MNISNPIQNYDSCYTSKNKLNINIIPIKDKFNLISKDKTSLENVVKECNILADNYNSSVYGIQKIPNTNNEGYNCYFNFKLKEDEVTTCSKDNNINNQLWIYKKLSGTSSNKLSDTSSNKPSDISSNKPSDTSNNKSSGTLNDIPMPISDKSSGTFYDTSSNTFSDNNMYPFLGLAALKPTSLKFEVHFKN